MDGTIWEAMLSQAPSLGGLLILSWYLLKRLARCEEARETLATEHADLRVRIAELEGQVLALK